MILINCIAIDDEPPALRQMKEYISRIPYLDLKATFNNAIDSMNFVKENPVDLIFLDIQMDKLTGIQFLKLLKDKPKIILTTAYDSYALEAFDLDVDDYILKPISFERFYKSTEKIYDNIQKEKQASKSLTTSTTEARDYFFVKTGFRVERIDFQDIFYIEGLKEYLAIYTPEKKILTLQSFDNILRNLPEKNFIRVHKSFIVALSKIENIEKNHILIKEKRIPIGARYRKDFFNYLKKYSL